MEKIAGQSRKARSGMPPSLLAFALTRHYRNKTANCVIPRWLFVVATFLAMIGVPQSASAVVNYSISFKPYTTNTGYLYCLDSSGYAITGASISTTMNWVTNSNSHLHAYSPGHPNSSISPQQGTTGSNGALTVTIYTTLIGQDEYINVTCSKPGYTTTTKPAYFTVGYADIYYNNHPEIWFNIGATGNHGGTDYNRYMTTYAAYQLYYTSYDYKALYPDVTLIGANDEALPYGGTFDLNSNWTFPHAYHYRGTAADMRGNTAEYTIPVSRQQNFVNFCYARGAELAQIEFGNPGDNDSYVADNRRHIHCHWPLIL